MVTNTQGFADIVISDQHANATLFEESNDALDLDHRNRVDAGKGLVKQNEAWLRRQRPGNFHPAPFTAREGKRRAQTQMLHPQVIQQRIESVVDVVARQRLSSRIALQLQHSPHVVLNVELAKDRCFLRQVA